MTDIIRLKKVSDNGTDVTYSQGFFGGLLRRDLRLEHYQLRQRFGGHIPAEIEIEIRAVTRDEEQEAASRDVRNHAIQEKREARDGKIEDMQIAGALARLQKKFG